MRDLIIDQLAATAQAANRTADKLFGALDEMDARTALDTATWQMEHAGRVLDDMGKRLERLGTAGNLTDDDLAACALAWDHLRTSVQTALYVAEMAAENLGDQAQADSAYTLGTGLLARTSA